VSNTECPSPDDTADAPGPPDTLPAAEEREARPTRPPLLARISSAVTAAHTAGVPF
jgi:hypothetical protein